VPLCGEASADTTRNGGPDRNIWKAVDKRLMVTSSRRMSGVSAHDVQCRDADQDGAFDWNEMIASRDRWKERKGERPGPDVREARTDGNGNGERR